MEKKINWGISKDLQADIRYEPNACKGYVMDISLGCAHRCIYCLFSPLELKVFKLQNPDYKGDVLPLKLDRFLAREKLPPTVYLCYSCDPLGSKDLYQPTARVLKKFFKHNVSVLLISKGIFSDEILEVIKMRPDLMEIQIGITNYDDKRNSLVEPGAPSYEERLKNIEKLSKIEGLGSFNVRIDPLLPTIDDTRENIERIIKDVSRFGVKEAVGGYIILTKTMREAWKRNEFIKKAAEALTEKTPTISEQELYSIPFEHKLEKFSMLREICRKNGVNFAVCGCKDEKLKNTDLEWICHPYNRKRRKELFKDSSYIMEIDHLK